MAYTVWCDTAVATKWWFTGTSGDNRLSDVIDDAIAAGGVEEDDNPGNFQPIGDFITEIIEDAIYRIHLRLEEGDGSTSTTLVSTYEVVYFDTGAGFTKTVNANLTIGAKQGSWGYGGSKWSFGGIARIAYGAGDIKVYGSLIESRVSDQHLNFRWGDVEILNSIISFVSQSASGYLFFQDSLTSLTVKDTFISHVNTVRNEFASATFEDIRIHYAIRGFRWNNADSSITDVLFTEVSTSDLYSSTANTGIVINPKSPITSIQLGNASGIGIEKFTCDIHTLDQSGADLASASVDCEYAHLVEGSDSKTYKCIADHTAVDADHKPITGTDWDDYWELYDSGGGLGGDWETGFAYKAGTTEFSTQTTDASGDMTQQTIEHRRWTGTSEIKTVRVHKFTISNAGYETVIFENVLISQKINWWNIELQHRVKHTLDGKRYEAIQEQKLRLLA